MSDSDTYVSGSQGSWIVFVYFSKKSSVHALGGVSGVISFFTIDEQLQ